MCTNVLISITCSKNSTDEICIFHYDILTFRYDRTSFCHKKSDHFSYITVFGKQELQLSQQRCFHAKEQTLSFSEHQKSLKSVYYSWRYLNFCIGVDNYCMWTRISCVMRPHDSHDGVVQIGDWRLWWNSQTWPVDFGRPPGESPIIEPGNGTIRSRAFQRGSNF